MVRFRSGRTVPNNNTTNHEEAVRPRSYARNGTYMFILLACIIMLTRFTQHSHPNSPSASSIVANAAPPVAWGKDAATTGGKLKKLVSSGAVAKSKSTVFSYEDIK